MDYKVERKNLITVILKIMSIEFILVFILTDIIYGIIVYYMEGRIIPISEIFIHSYNHLLNFDNIRIHRYSTKIIDIFHYLFSYVFFIFFTALLVNELSISSQQSKKLKSLNVFSRKYGI
jgi:hypothetical protein